MADQILAREEVALYVEAAAVLPVSMERGERLALLASHEALRAERDRLKAAVREARGGLEYAREQLQGFWFTCDCRMSGSGGCFEQCPLHAALQRLDALTRAEGGGG